MKNAKKVGEKWRNVVDFYVKVEINKPGFFKKPGLSLKRGCSSVFCFLIGIIKNFAVAIKHQFIPASDRRKISLGTQICLLQKMLGD